MELSNIGTHTVYQQDTAQVASDGFSISSIGYDEKTDVGTVNAVIFSTLGVHEYEKNKIRRRKASAGG
jgi:hypothetical protein